MKRLHAIIQQSNKILFYSEDFKYYSLDFAFEKQMKTIKFVASIPGCSTVGSVPVWGAGGRAFESRQPDIKSADWRIFLFSEL
jgi:hypothetical protein